MEKTVEFKIRVPEADRWEDIPIYLSKVLSGTADEIALDAQEIAEGIAFSKKSDVRWNYEGSLQGHYVKEIFPDEDIFKCEEYIVLLSEQSGVATE